MEPWKRREFLIVILRKIRIKLDLESIGLGQSLVLVRISLGSG